VLRVTLTVGFLLLLCLIVSRINSYNNKNKNTDIVHRIAVLSMTLKGQLNVDKDMESGIMGWDMTSNVLGHDKWSRKHKEIGTLKSYLGWGS
jgi:hypothetical protein